MKYKAGTNIFRMYKWEEVIPFLKLGREVVMGSSFPLKEKTVTSDLLKIASKAVPEGTRYEGAQLANWVYPTK